MKAFDKKILVDTFDFGYKKILSAIVSSGVGESYARAVLGKRLALPDRVQSLNSLFERLLISAQNASGKHNIIGLPILGVPNLRAVLCEFSPQCVLEKFGYNDASNKDKTVENILDAINNKFPNIGLNVNQPRLRRIEVAEGLFENREVQLNAFNDRLNTWNKFAYTIVDAAIFLQSYKSAEDFYDKADEAMKSDIHEFAQNIESQVYGIGYALACDFLKEVGVDCGKPDVHIKKILEGVTNQRKLNDQQLQEAMQIIAKEKKVTLFAVDKVFWMIGTTNFSINICNYRQSFINECRDNQK